MYYISKKKFLILVIAAIILGGTLTFGGVMLYQHTISDSVNISRSDFEKLQENYENYGMLGQLQQVIDTQYYKDVPYSQIKPWICKGLFAGLEDPYSYYMTKSEYEKMSVYTTGELYGIGVIFSPAEDGGIVIVNVMENSPADEAGIEAGDYIKAVDGTAVDASNYEDVSGKLRGTPGTKVKVTYSRNGKEKTVTVTRAKIVYDSVFPKVIDGNTGYIQISAFEKQTGKDFKTELRNMEMKGVDGIIIDLRNNGGGIVESGVEVADALLKEGVITYLEFKDGTRQYHKSDSGATSIPYVLLVNEQTASTSEIIAAAVKDSGSGKIIGTKTFGKGVIQKVMPLVNGDAIRLTVAQYFSPSGKVIQDEGVQPDISVEQKAGDSRDYQLEEALKLLRK
ncbi:MAG: S41 family peptidase [Clostridia bacterium]|nr:S41 family peptidase [Clostridia bacterium]